MVRAFLAQVGADVVVIPVNTAVKVTESPWAPTVLTGCVITPVEDLDYGLQTYIESPKLYICLMANYFLAIREK